MPRPSLERTIKYIPILPQANRKLSREARRGSHDLRKLVGHANFLDTLMFELNSGTVEEEDKVQAPGAEELPNIEDAKVLHWADLQDDDEDWETADSSSGSEIDDDDESEDESDEAITPETDEENNKSHALTRMISRGEGAATVPKAATLLTNPIATPELQHLANVAINGVAEHRGLDDDMSFIGKDVPKQQLDLGNDLEDYFGIQAETEAVAVANG